jgi:hypothetical protein
MYECIVCGQIVSEQEERYLLGVDMPYINLWLHRGCWYSIKSYSDQFLKDHLLEYIDKQSLIAKKRK